MSGASDSRLIIPPTPENGLRASSVVMTEKIYPVPRAKAGPAIGRLLRTEMEQIGVRLAFILGLGD